MSRYKIYVLLICIFSICIFQYACTKLENTNIVPITRDESVEDDDPDEIGYAFDDPEYSGELEERASTFKIVQVLTADSLPVYKPDGSGKKQKYAKRQIVSTSARTRFTLIGYGFKSQIADTSKVVAYIKGVEQPNVEIVSWSDTVVVVDFPVLTSELLINNTFSIKFKLWRANDKQGRTNVSRTKSKSCISDVKAATVKSCGLAPYDYIVKYRRDSLGLTTPVNITYVNINNSSYQNLSKYVPTVGDIVFIPANTENAAFDPDAVGIVTAIRSFPVGTFDILTRVTANCTNLSLFPAINSKLVYKLEAANSQSPLPGVLNPYQLVYPPTVTKGFRMYQR